MAREGQEEFPVRRFECFGGILLCLLAVAAARGSAFGQRQGTFVHLGDAAGDPRWYSVGALGGVAGASAGALATS